MIKILLPSPQSICLQKVRNTYVILEKIVERSFINMRIRERDKVKLDGFLLFKKVLQAD